MISSRHPNLARNRKNIVETALCSAPYAECFCVFNLGERMLLENISQLGFRVIIILAN